tara:strand:+ start:271 stop:783 length:513 start_codon:yes stop_codon:yes gene_type:complete
MRDKIEAFYIEFYDLYVRRNARRAGSMENAEDVVMEAFCRALKYADSFEVDNGRDLETWFNTIVRRALYDFKRVETKQGMTAAIDSGETEAVEIDGVDQAMAEEILKIIESKENTEHRNVLFLAFVRNYPPRDIVEVLDLGLHSVYQIIKRFRGEMNERYGYNRQTESFS